MSRTIRNSIASALVAAALGVLLGGCGSNSQVQEKSAGSGGPAAEQRPPGGPGNFDSAATEELRNCLDKQGVELPDQGQGPPSGAARSKLRDAMEECSQYLPSGGPGAGGLPEGAPGQ